MLEPGFQVGRYEIHRRLGRGGMGTVYVAHDPVLGRMVAIKLFAGDLDMSDAHERFAREARSAAALNHPHIVTVYDYGEIAAQPYIVMEYVPGETLAQMIRRKAPVALPDKLRWIEELCAGAGYAHSMSVIHRDIKPANLIIDRSGRLKILDFGIARMIGTVSNTVAMIGTPGYMAPEQIQGQTADHRSDLFSIGVVLYELLAYQEAFPGESLPAITHRILSEEPTPLATLVPDVHEQVVGIVELALKKDAADRFRDAESLRTAVNRVRREIEGDSRWETLPSGPGRNITSDAGSNRGTGSSRRRLSGTAGVAELTPTPDPRRLDRDALARRRTALLESALAEARSLLERQDLNAALEACLEALTYDENHPGALELEQIVRSAVTKRDALTIASAATALTVEPFADRPSDEAETRLSDPIGTPKFATPRYESRAGSPPPTPTPATASAGPITSRVSQDEPTVLADSGIAAATDPSTPVATAVPVATVAAGNRVAAKLLPWTTSTLGKVVASVMATLAVVAVVRYTGGGTATGTLVVDAVPWAEITAIESANGERLPLPSSASTPVVVTLPAGTYEMTLTGPPPNPEAQRVTVRVEAGTLNVAPAVQFRTMTPEEYFEEYLAAVPAAPEAGAEPPPATISAPAPASPDGAGQ